MSSDESHFNISLIFRDKVTKQCPQTTTFEEKGELKRIRTKVPLLTSLTPYRYAKLVHHTRTVTGQQLYIICILLLRSVHGWYIVVFVHICNLCMSMVFVLNFALDCEVFWTKAL